MRSKTSKLLMGVSVLSMSMASAATAVAQEAPAEDEVSVQETITITGSRIPSDPNLISSVPVQSVSDEDILLSGELNLADVVNDIPALISSLTGENSVTGANALNLRGLGAERSLTLVNGRRHVAGFRGSSAVDVGTIPRALVESVEVTTGGASAIYGADAVTGVVNFIMKDDFEGFEFDARAGISGEWDAENFAFDAIYGKNFHNGRGNITFALTVEEDSGLTQGERDWSRDNQIKATGPNPDLRLQEGDLSANTPNFNATYDPWGSVINRDDFAEGTVFTAEEEALFDRAENAPARVVLDEPSVWLSSQEGSIAPSFFGRETTYVDINDNGVADCQESNAGQDPFLAGCWFVDDNGEVQVFQDGLISSSTFLGSNVEGGTHGALEFNGDTLYPETDRYVFNMTTNYEVADDFELFFEGKYVYSESTTFAEQDTFYDTLFITADNAFIPDELQPVVDVTGGLLLTQDPVDFTENNPDTNTRETIRFVGGFEWEPAPGHIVEYSMNHGRFKNTTNTTGLYLDRIFSAIDAVEDPDTGEIVCRSDIDPVGYSIDFFTSLNGYTDNDGSYFSDRFYSFTPGDGQCQPLDPFGVGSVSQEAQDFITADLEDVLEIEQTVVSLISAGSFDVGEGFLDGAIGYAAGVEYRSESSDNQLDPLTLGILPEGTSFTPGIDVNQVDPFLNSFISIDNVEQFNTQGSYDVAEIFAELRLPILRDRQFAKELTVDGAVRLASYSTLGEAPTWKVGATWAPSSDISFRATVSEAVRAPNISELFDPKLPEQFDAGVDPCDVNEIGNGSGNREANCIADLQAAGVDLSEIVNASGAYIWDNPLTGRFTGVSGGNPDLDVETAETFTIGAVITPSFVDGLSITLDYWDITIEDAIAAISATDILEGCLDSTTFPQQEFCNLYTRRDDGGLNFLDSSQINFAALEASGFDLAVNYGFDVGPNSFTASLVGSQQEKLDQFFNPLDPSDVNPEVGEIQVPEYSGNLNLGWRRGPMSINFQTSYQSEQSVDEIEDRNLYGDDFFYDDTYIFDVNAAFMLRDGLRVYGGVNNLTDEEPFSIETAWPVSPRGRFFFLGATYTY